jgi:hypothetical protein
MRAIVVVWDSSDINIRTECNSSRLQAALLRGYCGDMRILWLSAASILAVACGTTPVPSSDANPVPTDRIYATQYAKPLPGYAFLVVTRDKGMRAKACTARIYIDGTVVADLRPSEQARLFVEEGEHVIGVSSEGSVCLGGADQTTVTVTRTSRCCFTLKRGMATHDDRA